MSGQNERRAGAGASSAAAQAFIAAAPPARAVALTAANVAALRAQTLADFTPRARRAADRHGVRLGEIELAGIPCLEILPPSPRPGATILYCFGGGYVAGSPFEDLPVSAPLAALTGARIVAPKYRLAPEHPWPAAVDDGFAVYRALAREERSGGLAAAGESAGGNLALVLLHRARRAGLAMPAAAALLSPWCDLTWRWDSQDGGAGRDPTLHPDHVKQAVAAYAGGRDAADPDVSPIYGGFDREYPPTAITTGTRDLLQGQCRRLAQVMDAGDVTVDLRVWDGLWHVFEFYDEIPEAARSLEQVAAFLKRHLDTTMR